MCICLCVSVCMSLCVCFDSLCLVPSLAQTDSQSNYLEHNGTKFYGQIQYTRRPHTTRHRPLVTAIAIAQHKPLESQRFNRLFVAQSGRSSSVWTPLYIRRLRRWYPLNRKLLSITQQRAEVLWETNRDVCIACNKF